VPANDLHHTWFRLIRQLCPGEHEARKRNMVCLLIGIYRSKSVHLSKIAVKIPWEKATLPSSVRRLSRLLANPRLRVREWYGPIATRLVESQAKTTGRVRLIIDSTKVGFGHQLLMVAIAYRRRALPLAWDWVKGSRGHSSTDKQLGLLTYLHELIPVNVPVSLVGDAEFCGSNLLKQMDIWRWHYALRQKASHLIQLPGQETWIPFGDLVQQPGQSCWIEQALLTEKYAYPTSLLAYWKIGEKDAWLLATNMPDQRTTLAAYRRRMWMEEMFGDFKGHGFDLESSHLRHAARLSRLTLAVALLYVWLVSTGSRTIKAGRRFFVDRRDRRDLSIFRIGLYTIDRFITLSQPLPRHLVPYFR
jgi:hypothetical protein